MALCGDSSRWLIGRMAGAHDGTSLCDPVLAHHFRHASVHSHSQDGTGLSGLHLRSFLTGTSLAGQIASLARNEGLFDLLCACCQCCLWCSCCDGNIFGVMWLALKCREEDWHMAQRKVSCVSCVMTPAQRQGLLPPVNNREV